MPSCQTEDGDREPPKSLEMNGQLCYGNDQLSKLLLQPVGILTISFLLAALMFQIS